MGLLTVELCLEPPYMMFEVDLEGRGGMNRRRIGGNAPPGVLSL